MHAAGTIESRRKLFLLLIKEGMLDNLLKAMVRSEVRKSLANLLKED
jgi:hypothetical protein